MPWNASQVEDEQEDHVEGSGSTWGLVGSVIMYFVQGGRNCCSMRTEAQPSSSEDASAEVWKRAPQQQQKPVFPEAPGHTSGRDEACLGDGCGQSPSKKQAWEWPKWCLAYFEPCVEVYVIDDETDKRKWVGGMPRERVMDEKGQDAYLSVEYMWEGELFIQEFPPEHVRQPGRTATVRDFLERGEL